MFQTILLRNMPSGGWIRRRAAKRTVESLSIRGSYDEIKSQCQSAGKLWEDPEFPAVESSLFYRKPEQSNLVTHGCEWKRPPVSTTINCRPTRLVIDAFCRNEFLAFINLNRLSQRRYESSYIFLFLMRNI